MSLLRLRCCFFMATAFFSTLDANTFEEMKVNYLRSVTEGHFSHGIISSWLHLNGIDGVSGQKDQKRGNDEDDEEQEDAPDLGQHRLEQVFLSCRRISSDYHWRSYTKNVFANLSAWFSQSTYPKLWSERAKTWGRVTRFSDFGHLI